MYKKKYINNIECFHDRKKLTGEFKFFSTLSKTNFKLFFLLSIFHEQQQTVVQQRQRRDGEEKNKKKQFRQIRRRTWFKICIKLINFSRLLSREFVASLLFLSLIHFLKQTLKIKIKVQMIWCFCPVSFWFVWDFCIFH